MRTTRLGKTGLEVSAVGFGGIPIQRISDDEAATVIHRALQLGVNFIDTAAGYGDSQKKIGRAIHDRRDGLVLASKSPAKTRDEMAADIDRSRREMRTDTIELYQCHCVGSREAWEKITAPGGAMEALEEARQNGWVQHIGVTAHSLETALELVGDPRIETLQFPFNLVTSEPADELIPRCRKHQVGFIVMKPLCGGQYDNANLAFKFLNAYPDLVPIPGIETEAEIEEIAALVAGGQTLTGEEREQAEQIAADLGKLFCRRCGYCMPCPQGVPVQLAMIFGSFLKRMPAERNKTMARDLIEKIDQCTECRACEQKCPYDLPILETLAQTRRQAEELIALPG